jgi:hypothetical protein
MDAYIEYYSVYDPESKRCCLVTLSSDRSRCGYAFYSHNISGLSLAATVKPKYDTKLVLEALRYSDQAPMLLWLATELLRRFVIGEAIPKFELGMPETGIERYFRELEEQTKL